MIIHTTHWFVLTYLFFHSFTHRVTVLVRKDAGYTNSKVEKARGGDGRRKGTPAEERLTNPQ